MKASKWVCGVTTTRTLPAAPPGRDRSSTARCAARAKRAAAAASPGCARTLSPGLSRARDSAPKGAAAAVSAAAAAAASPAASALLLPAASRALGEPRPAATEYGESSSKLAAVACRSSEVRGSRYSRGVEGRWCSKWEGRAGWGQHTLPRGSPSAPSPAGPPLLLVPAAARPGGRVSTRGWPPRGWRR